MTIIYGLVKLPKVPKEPSSVVKITGTVVIDCLMRTTPNHMHIRVYGFLRGLSHSVRDASLTYSTFSF